MRRVRTTLVLVFVSLAPARAMAGEDEQLVEATKRGEVAKVAKLLRGGADPNVMTITKVIGEDENAQETLFDRQTRLFNWLITRASDDPEYPKPPAEEVSAMIRLFVQAGVDLDYSEGRQSTGFRAVLFATDASIRTLSECDAFTAGGRAEISSSGHARLSSLVDAPPQVKAEPSKDLGPDAMKTKTTAIGKVDATNTLASKKNAYRPEHATDANLATAWVEGSKWPGRCEGLDFEVAEANDAPRFVIINGYAKSPDVWKQNARIKTAKVFVNDAAIALVQLLDTIDPQTFTLGKTKLKPGDKVAFRIIHTYAGTKYEDTAITELRLVR